MHIAVNFHYVGMPDFPFSGIHGLDPDAFREIVMKLKGDFEMVSLPDVVAAVQNEGRLPERSCLITFDDGLRCQYEQAVPVLDDLGIPAAFFVMGAPYLEGRVPTVHMLHWSRANHGDAKVLELVEEWAGEHGLSQHPADIDIQEARKLNPYDDADAARLKYFLTRTIDESTLQAILDHLFSALGVDSEDFISTFFMSKDMIKELAARGMIGSHALSHRPLAGLSDDDIYKELNQTKGFLESICGDSIHALSYPYGIADSVDHRVAEQARRVGHRAAYTMERAYNATIDDGLLLARIDNRDIETIPALKERSRYRA